MKRILKFGMVVLAVLAVSGVGLWYYLGRIGSSSLEQWIGSQIVAVLESHITPRVSFGKVDYRAPRTVVVDDLTLTEQNVPIISIRRMLLELTEVPREGQPIRVQKIELDKPHLKFITSSTGSFVGWQPFVRPEVKNNPDAVPAGRRFSDVLELRHVAIRDGEMIYDLGDGSEPMVLPGIDTILETPPVAGEPGWYALAGTLQREPIFHIDIDSRINLDTGLLDVKKLQLRAALSEREYATLPPQVQTLLRRYEVQGQLQASASGQVPFKQIERSEGQLQADIQKGRFAVKKTVWPIERFNVTADCRDQKANLKCDGSLMGGRVTAQANVQWIDAKPFNAAWQINGIRIEDMLRATQSGAPQHAGRVVSHGQMAGRWADFPASISGTGKLLVEDGKLMNMPLLRELFTAVAKIKLGADLASKDTARAEFQLRSDRFDMTEMEVASALMRLKGNGQIFYDSRLNLDVNANVTEAVQGVLGKTGLGRVGELIGEVTSVGSKVVTYHVTGTWSQPAVGIKPLGLK